MNVAGLTLDQIIEALAVEQRAHLAALEARVAALTAALDEANARADGWRLAAEGVKAYGDHLPECPYAPALRQPCTCGWQAALDAAGGA